MMQAAAAALTVLSVFLGLDFLSAHRPEPDLTEKQNGSDIRSDEAAQKKNPPHIIFILIDDQVCVCWCVFSYFRCLKKFLTCNKPN